MIIFLVLIIAISGISLIGYLNTGKAKNEGSVELAVTVFNKSETVKYVFSNMTALELLQKDNQVNTTYSKYGAFVNCINEICSNNNYYWMYYVNGEMVSVGAADYRIKDNDTIEFRYGKNEF